MRCDSFGFTALPITLCNPGQEQTLQYTTTQSQTKQNWFAAFIALFGVPEELLVNFLWRKSREKPTHFKCKSSSETQGQLVGTIQSANENENANWWQNFFPRKNRAHGIVSLPGEIYVIFSMETASACSTEITGGFPQRFLTGRKQTNYATDKTHKRLCKRLKPCKRETSARRVRFQVLFIFHYLSRPLFRGSFA